MDKKSKSSHKKVSYLPLVWMSLLSFLSMYILMYMMVDRMANVIPNTNQFYMAGMMTAPMIVFELLLMSQMYGGIKKNVPLIISATAALIILIFFTRTQTGIDNKQFLKSMIPHHAGAILMCEQANITDPEIQDLCEDIIDNQQREIDIMQGMLSSMKK